MTLNDKEQRENFETRIRYLERVISRNGRYALPDRLNPSGARTTDWNTAIWDGFYWCDSSAANRPAGQSWLVGFVLRNEMPNWRRVVQTVWQPLAGGSFPYQRTWRRVGTVSDADPTSVTWGSWNNDLAFPNWPDVGTLQMSNDGVPGTWSSGWGHHYGSNWGGVNYTRRGGWANINGAAQKGSAIVEGETVITMAAGWRSMRQIQGTNCQLLADSSGGNGYKLIAGIPGGGTAFSFDITYPVFA